MNFILTPDQLKTLMASLGKKELFGVRDCGAPLDRETAVRCIAELVRGGLLIPEENALRCRKELRQLLRPLLAPRRVFQWLDPVSGAQLVGYCDGRDCTLLGSLAGQKNAIRLFACGQRRLAELLEEEGLLPDESTGEIAGLPPFFNESGEWLLTRGAQQGVLGWIDLYDPETHRREARGMLCKTGQATLLATEDSRGTAARTYRKNALAQWLDVHMNGETA